MGVVRGANCPMVLRTVTEQLAQEHKVLDGTAERKEVSVHQPLSSIFMMGFGCIFILCACMICGYNDFPPKSI